MMSKLMMYSAAIAIFSFAISVVGFSCWNSFRSYPVESGGIGAEESTNSAVRSPDKQAREVTDEAIARYNFWLVIFTAVLAFVALLQIGFMLSADKTASDSASAAKLAADTAKRSLIDVQRAFVFQDGFDTEFINNSLIIMPKWRNSGATPTRMMRNWVSWMLFDGTPPVTFDYPDLGPDGKTEPASHDFAPLVFVGPQATRYGEALTLDASLLDAMRTGQKRLFVWGWARYKDVFGTEHLSRFCNEIRMTNAHVLIDQKDAGDRPVVRAAIDFPQFGKYNCVDEECVVQGFP